MKKIIFVMGIVIIPMILGVFFSKGISHADDSDEKTQTTIFQGTEVNKQTTSAKEEKVDVVQKKDHENSKQVKDKEHLKSTKDTSKTNTVKPEKSPTNTHQIETPQKEKIEEEIVNVNKVAVSEEVYTTIPTSEKHVALTFDDGPDDKYTLKVLEILASYDIKATFFVIGKNILEYPNSMEKIISEGHAIGNHTWSHADLTSLSVEQIKSEMDQTKQLLQAQFDIETDIMRPPFGAMDDRTLKILSDLQLHTIKWSVDTRDWAGTASELMIENVNDNINSGGIVLQHSAGGKGGNLDNTIAALPTIIENLLNQGYQFVTVPELLVMKQ